MGLEKEKTAASGNCKIVLHNTERLGGEMELRMAEAAGLSGVRVIRADGSDEQFLKEAEDADAVIITYIQLTPERIARLRRCRVIAVQSIGVNNVDLDAATAAGIYVCNVPDYCIEEVAVHTIALMLDGMRKLSQMDRLIRDGDWPDKRACGRMRRISGCRWGLVAFGNIPKRIAQIIKSMGAEVCAYDPFVEDSVFADAGVQRADSLENLFAQCDFISVHSPLLPSTRHSIGDVQFNAIRRDGALLVVTGRGGAVDEAALKRAIEADKIVFAGLDVIEDEANAVKQGWKSQLAGMDQVVMTPHVAFYSDEAMLDLREKAMSQVLEVLCYGQVPKYLVNRR